MTFCPQLEPSMALASGGQALESSTRCPSPSISETDNPLQAVKDLRIICMPQRPRPSQSWAKQAKTFKACQW